MEVTLDIPALITTFNEIDSGVIDGLRLDSLKHLLSRSRTQKTNAMTYEALLYQQFIKQDRAAGQIPFASLTARLDGLQSGSGAWMRADPVYLYPDTHTLIMQDPLQLQLTAGEREALASTIRPLFSEFGATLHTPVSSRWYLHFPDTVPRLLCTPAFEAVMQPVNDLLPTGDDARRWHTLFNEIQMLLNQSDINENRQSHGLQPINSLWFWGLGESPANPGPAYDCCIGGNDFVQALCQHTASRHKTITGGLSVSRYQNKSLILEERLLHARRLNNPEQWLAALRMIDSEVIAPVLNGLRKGVISRLVIKTDCSRQFECTYRGMRLFWKRNRPVSSFIMD